MELSELLATKVSYQDRFWDETRDVTLGAVLDEIKSVKHREFINYLRNLYTHDMESYGKNKTKLPGVLFCGSFNKKRKKEFLNTYNYIVVLDIDKLESAEMERVLKALKNEPIVFSFWISPSNCGIKGLVHLNYCEQVEKERVDELHKTAFSQLVQYFETEHEIELDTSGSDFSRLCFLTYDSLLVLKDEITPFEVKKVDIVKTKKEKKGKIPALKKVKFQDTLHNPSGKNNKADRKMMKNIIKYIQKNTVSITYTYEDWLRVAFAISNSFTFDIGLKYFVELCKQDKGKYDEINCTNFLINCYEVSRGEIGFDTIIYLAQNKGFKNKRNGNAEST